MAYGIIYKAINTVNGKVYIGQTTKTLKKRKEKHFIKAFILNSPFAFYRAIRKYGENAFIWEELGTYPNKLELDIAETNYINHYNSCENGYNMTYGGSGGIPSSEVKDKIRQGKLGELNPMFGKKGELCPNYGRIRTIETRRKIGDYLRGKPSWNKGIPMKDITKEKQSKIHRKSYIIITPNREEIAVNGIVNFCKSFKQDILRPGHLINVAKGKATNHKGYQCQYV